MADRAGRRKQPFRLWFPSWASPSRVSRRPLPQPPSTASISPSSQSLLQTSEGTETEFRNDRTADQTQMPSPLQKTLQPSTAADSHDSKLALMEEKPSESSKLNELEMASISQSSIPESRLDEFNAETQIQKNNNYIKTSEAMKITEEPHFKEDESKKEEESAKITKPKISITLSDSVPELDDNGTFNESNVQSSAKKERKITVSTMRSRSNKQQEFNNGVSELLQELNIGKRNKPGNEHGANIVTLASENKGASMCIGHDQLQREKYHNLRRNPSISASINSNVQSINSSIVNESNYSERNPGVHLTICSKPTVPMNFTEKTESQKAANSIETPQKRIYEPNIRRRCLRGLFLESSEDDMKDPKPRRHGCRFTCDENRKEKDDAGNLKK